MAKIFYAKDCDLSLLSGKTVAIIGFGSQGHAHAMNLRDSGVNVIVGQRKSDTSKNYKAAVEAGFEVVEADEATKRADIIMILVPDTIQGDLFRTKIEPNLKPGKTLAWAHGFNIHFKAVVPPADVDIFMIAPKAPGHMVRDEYTRGAGTPCLVAVYQDATGNALKTALAYGAGIGGARAGILETTFKEETETDLFGEQTVLCGGSAQLIKYGFETLIEAGYQPELAYFEVMHELKLIVDLYYRGGLEFMNYSVSDTAEYGGLTVGPKVIGPEVKVRMKEALTRIQTGEFAKEFLGEFQSGSKNFTKLREADAAHPIEKIGKELRNMMSWIKR